MLQLLTREALAAGGNPGRTARPTLCLTWKLDPLTGKPIGRWIVADAEPTGRFALASAA